MDPTVIARLRILHVEDSPADALLIRSQLETEGIAAEIELVEDEPAYRSSLERGEFDLILSDFTLPSFDGLAALRLAKALAPEVPFIFVSGSIGEDAAILGVRSGARDYVLKHKLTRLGPAVRRAAQESSERRQRQSAEAALRRNEEHQRQTQKLEALGRLAGGVAHDFNNLLTVILGCSQMARERLENNESVDEDLEQIQEAGTRAAALTRQLLAFSRQQILQPRVLDLNAVVAGVEMLLRRVTGVKIEFFTSLTSEVAAISADPGQIEQILMNLVVNARDAMPEGGKLTLETRPTTIGAGSVGAPVSLLPGKYILLAVSDTGQGMDAATRARIFEPFFTTKEVGQGTGLGLSTVHGIVTQSGGTIEVYSEVGQGTSFKIYLPRAASPVEASDIANGTPAPMLRGTGAVLVVEDDDLVRPVLTQILASHGYEVIVAESPSRALDLVRQRADVDLILSDIVMPGCNGPELVDRLREQSCQAPVLFMSGYTDKAVIHHGLLNPRSNFLQKPFTPEVLLAKVRSLLHKGEARAA